MSATRPLPTDRYNVTYLPWIVNGWETIYARSQQEAFELYDAKHGEHGDEAWSAFPRDLACNGCGEWGGTPHSSWCPIAPTL